MKYLYRGRSITPCYQMRSSDKSKSKLIHSTKPVVESRIPSVSRMLDSNKFGGFKRLTRVTAFVLRFLRNSRSKGTEEKLVGLFSSEEYDSAEILRLKEMQKAVVKSPRFESLKQQLGLYSDAREDFKTHPYLLMLNILFFCQLTI